MLVGKEEGKVLESHPAGERVGVEVTDTRWRGLNAWINCGSVHSAGGSQPYSNRERNGAAALSAAAAGNAWDTANMSPDGRGGTHYILKK